MSPPPRMPPSHLSSQQRINTLVRHIRHLTFDSPDLIALELHPLSPIASHFNPKLRLRHRPRPLILYSPSSTPTQAKVKRLLIHLHLLDPTKAELRIISQYVTDRAYCIRGCEALARGYDEEWEFAEKSADQYSWLLELEEGRRRHVRPYQYVSPGVEGWKRERARRGMQVLGS